MRLVVLCDNNTFIDNYLLGEPALSFYIENGDDKILFDLGYSDVYVKNADKIGIDMAKINKIVLSHGHDDHTKGLKYYNFNPNTKCYYCPGCFDEKFCENTNISAPFTQEEMSKRFVLEKIEHPTEISKNIYCLGPIPRITVFEKENPNLKVLKDGMQVQDTVDEDTALVVNGNKHLIIVTGCSHSGICNICEYAKAYFKKPIKAIIGGFHLLQLNEQAKETIAYFKNEEIDLYPCHCTSLFVKAEMIKQKLNVHDVGSGLELTIE